MVAPREAHHQTPVALWSSRAGFPAVKITAGVKPHNLRVKNKELVSVTCDPEITASAWSTVQQEALKIPAAHQIAMEHKLPDPKISVWFTQRHKVLHECL